MGNTPLEDGLMEELPVAADGIWALGMRERWEEKVPELQVNDSKQTPKGKGEAVPSASCSLSCSPTDHRAPMTPGHRHHHLSHLRPCGEEQNLWGAGLRGLSSKSL